MREWYWGRSAAAVVQYNSDKAHNNLHKELCPGTLTKTTKIIGKRCWELTTRKQSKKSLFSSNFGCDKDYGLSAPYPDVVYDTTAKESEVFENFTEKWRSSKSWEELGQPKWKWLMVGSSEELADSLQFQQSAKCDLKPAVNQ